MIFFNRALLASMDSRGMRPAEYGPPPRTASQLSDSLTHFAGAGVAGALVEGAGAVAAASFAAFSFASDLALSRFRRYEDFGRPGITVCSAPKYQRPKMRPAKTINAMILSRAEWDSANGSKRSRCVPGGSLATPVSEAPKGMLILARAFTAQPFASRIGPRLRWRSLSHAMTIEGSEIASIAPMTMKGTFQVGISANFENTTPRAVANEPRPTPRAATVPVSSFFGSAGLILSAPATTEAVTASFSVAAASAAAARLAICSSIKRTNRL